MNLTECLTSNSTLLGPNCENLGKTMGKGCCFWNRYKVYLSCDSKNHWKVEKFNLFFVLLRKIFGCFLSTHLSRVKNEVTKLLADPIQKDAALRIQNVWNPFICLGNTDPTKAQVVCFADDHTDEAGVAFRETFIAKHWEKGAIVLVEGEQAGKVVAKTSPLRPHLPDDYLVQGWEPANFKELISSYSTQSKAMLAELNGCLDYLKEDLPLDGEIPLVKKAEIKGKLDNIKDTLKRLNKFYQSKGPCISNIDKAFDSHFQLLSENKITGKILLLLVSDPIFELSKRHYDTWNKSLSPEQLQSMYKAAAIRNDSLIAEMQKQIAAGRKVFVIGGSGHLLQLPISDNSCQRVKEALHKFRFSILTRTKFENKPLAPLNLDLEQHSF